MTKKRVYRSRKTSDQGLVQQMISEAGTKKIMFPGVVPLVAV
jgi:hypothetical protein